MRQSQFSWSEIDDAFERFQSDLVIQASDFSLQGLHDMVLQGVIDLSPQYQRRSRWDITRQSQLIESFLLNVPVPPIYLAEEDYGSYSIIDGKQRITAVNEFLSDSFSLKGIESFPELEGARYSDLPPKLKNALRVRPYLRVTTLLRQSDPDLKYEVFIRLNRGGMTLNNQEIRNVAFRGPLNDTIYRLADNETFKRILGIESKKSSAYQHMQDAEYVLRFLTLLPKWREFSGSLSKSMDDFMRDNRDASHRFLDSASAIFEEALERVDSLWGDSAFQRWDGDRWRQQALAGMFDAQMIAAAELSDGHYTEARRSPEQVVEKTKDLFSDPDFEEAVRIGTNTPARLKLRVERLLQVLQN